MGLEPTQACAHKILSLARLPVPTLPRIVPIDSRRAARMIYYHSEKQKSIVSVQTSHYASLFFFSAIATLCIREKLKAHSLSVLVSRRMLLSSPPRTDTTGRAVHIHILVQCGLKSASVHFLRCLERLAKKIRLNLRAQILCALSFSLLRFSRFLPPF